MAFHAARPKIRVSSAIVANPAEPEDTCQESSEGYPESPKIKR
jgi:hypothetical protein